MEYFAHGINDETADPKRCCREIGICLCVSVPIVLMFTILVVAKWLDKQYLCVLLIFPLICLFAVFALKIKHLPAGPERRVYMPLDSGVYEL